MIDGMTEEKTFFNILRNSLWGTAITVPSEFDKWKKVFAIAKSQSVLGLVANTVLGNPALACRVPVEVQKRLKAFLMSNMATHTLLNNTLIRVVTLMEDAGIKPLLLKGQGLAQNYPLPVLRQCGDIDLYVGEENYVKACRLIDTIATRMIPEEVCESDKHYDAMVGDITVEIHKYSDVNASEYYDAIYQKYSDEGLSEGLRKLELAGISVDTPEDTFNAFYIFNHLWHHFLTSGVGLRQFIDWMLFLHRHRSDIDLSKLKMILDDMDLMGPWQSFGCILVEELGMSPSDFPFYCDNRKRNVKRVLRKVLQEGNFGKERAYYGKREGEGYLAGKIKSLGYQLSRYFDLMLVFPSHAFRQFMHMIRIGFKAVWKDKFSEK